MNRLVGIGHAVPTYPRKAWSRIPKGVNLDDVWQLVGPQVDMHLNNMPLWKVFCVVYIEGLTHGAGAVPGLGAIREGGG